MLCPKCYGKVDSKQQRWQYCGFFMKELDNASNKQAKKAMKSIYKDDVLYSTKIPYDVSKKKLLLFAIFLGLFGVHHFYVGKLWHGLFMSITMSVTLILAITLMIMNTIFDNVVQRIFEFWLIFQGLNIIFWVWDIFKIMFERFKIPVYKDSFSKK